MGRKRYITSDMSHDGRVSPLAEVNPIAAACWPWIINSLDDYGRMLADSREVKYQVFPAFPFSLDDVQAMLGAYADAGLVVLYSHEGHQYLQVNPRTYYAIQTYIPKERQRRDASKCPPPFGHPWAEYWPESVWRSRTPSVADSSAEQRSATQSSAESHEVAQNVLSPSPSLSPSPRDTSAAAEGGLGGGRPAAADGLVNPYTGEPLSDRWERAYEQLTGGNCCPIPSAMQFANWCGAGLDSRIVVRALVEAVMRKSHTPDRYAQRIVGNLVGAGVQTYDQAQGYWASARGSNSATGPPPAQRLDDIDATIAALNRRQEETKPP